MKIGWLGEHRRASASVSLIGQQLSPVGFKVRAIPLPPGSDLCLGI